MDEKREKNYNTNPRMLLGLQILDVLAKYSDADHTLSQKEVARLLDVEYGVSADRKTISRTLAVLADSDYLRNNGMEIVSTNETERMMPAKDPETGEAEMRRTGVMSDFYLIRNFEDSEIRLLIDSLIFSKHIPVRKRRDLARKLGDTQSKYFRSGISHVEPAPAGREYNEQLFFTVDILAEAIEKKCKVEFEYLEYHTDKRLYPRRASDGSPRKYLINPYQLAANEGRYYLICNYDKYDDVANYRVDRIRNVRLLEDEPAKPFSRLSDSNGDPLDLSRYMQEHIYMFTGGNTTVTFSVRRSLVSEMIDDFGDKISFIGEDGDFVTARVTVNEMAMRRFALSYLGDVTVLAPKSLVDSIKQAIGAASKAYE